MHFLNLHNETFWLLKERAVYWPAKKTIIVTDLHLGKTGHFRKLGIAVPQQVFKEDMQRLLTLIQMYKPEQLVVIGDLVHSRYNKELDLFVRWRNDFSTLTIQLVKGNHDILDKNWYEGSAIQLNNSLTIENFVFIHDYNDITKLPEMSRPGYCFSGHIHPGITIRTGSRQALSFPCYYFSEDYAVLPAFSKFTGFGIIRPKGKDRVFAIVENNIITI